MKISHSLLGSILILFSGAGLEAQTLSVDKPSLAFSAQVGGPIVTQPLNVLSSGGPIVFFAQSSTPWIKVNPSSGTAPSALTVGADPTGLVASTLPYQGTLSIFWGSSRLDVNVTLTLGPVSVSPASLTFTYQLGGTIPATQSITLAASQATSVNLTVTTASGGNWLQVTPATGTAPGTASVSLNSALVPSLTPATYNGTVTITPTSGSSAAAATVAVTLTVTGAPPVTVSPASAALNFQIGGTNNLAQQTVTLSSTGTQAVAYGLSAAVDPNPAGRVWFTFTPSGGNIPASGTTQVTVSYDTTANLPAGTYTGRLTLATPGGTPQQQTIPVTLLVSSSPLINVSPSALSYTYQVGASNPASQNVTVSSTSSAQVPLLVSTVSTGNWLSAPATGVTGTAIPISVNAANLVPNTYTGTVFIAGTGAANGPLQVGVTLVVANNPVIVVSANGCSTAINQNCSMVFASQIGQAGAPAQSLRITSSTGAALNYTITPTFPNVGAACAGAWLLPNSALTASGTTDATVPIVVNAGGVTPQRCDGVLSIAATNAATGAAVPNSPLTVPVSMYVSNSALLVVNQTALNFVAPVSGQSPAAQSVTIASSSATDQLAYTVAATTTNGGPWLFINQTAGTTVAGASNSLTVQVFPGLLSPGTYTGTITITATGPGGAAVADSPVTIPVTFQVTSGTMSVSPALLSFSQTAGGAAPAAQTVSVSSTGPVALAYTVTAQVTSTNGSVNWLTATPANGNTPGTITVSVDGSKLPAGLYNGTVTVTSTTPSTGGSPATIPVSLTVLSGTIGTTTQSLTFAQAVGGPQPASQTVNVTGTPGPIAITIAASADNGGTWLTASPASGNTPGTVTVTASAGSLPVGQYTGKVTITAAPPGATGSPITIPVTLNVVTGQTLTASPTTLNFTSVLGVTAAPAGQTVQVAATGGAAPFTATAATKDGGTWLQVSPASGNTPAPLTVTVNPQGLAASNYVGTITIASSASTAPVTVTVNLTVAVVPKPLVTSIGNAASYLTGGISPGENIVIFGTGIGPADLATGTLTTLGAFSTTAGNTQVLFDGTPAPVIYASDKQTSVMVPYGIFGRPVTTVRVSYQGVLSDPIQYNVFQAAPGIYTLNQSGTGPGAILNQNNSVNGPGNPAAKSSVISVYMSGEGETTSVPADGALAPTNGTGLFHPLLTVSATVGGIPAVVTYSGSAPGIVYGVMQVNLSIPSGVNSGPQPVVISLSNAGTGQVFATQAGVTVTVQ